MQIPQHILDIYRRSSCLYSKAEVEEALSKMAVHISEVLSDKNPILLCVMIGGVVPVGNLLPHLDFPLELHYVHATRYRGEMRPGELHWKASPSFDIKDRTVLIVDDILDGGGTLAAIVEYCKQQQAREVYTAVLVDKEHPRDPGGLERADFTALTVDDHFIFGYGMDYKEYLRNAPGIFVVDPQDE